VRECCTCLGKRINDFITRECNITRNPTEAQSNMSGQGVEEGPNDPRLWLEKRRNKERRVKANWELINNTS